MGQIYLDTWRKHNQCIMPHDSCVKALDSALEGFNTDQGNQFVNMDGRVRAFDNIFIEHLWRMIKHEEINIFHHQWIKLAFCGFKQCFEFYDKDSLYSSLGYFTPEKITVKDRQQKSPLDN